MTETAAALPAERAAALLEDATRWIRANQPNARVKVLGGHLMLQEYPVAFNNAVLSFLAGR